MSNKHVIVIRGGLSSEREVSLASGANVINALQTAGYQVTDLIADENVTEIIDFLNHHKPDVVFNALHGQYGEDGAIQGILEWMKIPYTHCDICTSAVTMNKHLTRILLSNARLPIAPGKLIPVTSLTETDPLPIPYVLKPVSEGSSVGVHLIQETDPVKRMEQKKHILQKWHYGDHALVEEFIPGKELTVCVMDNRALTITDISSGTHLFYDYASKYQAGQSTHTIPANIHPEAFRQALAYAEIAHRTLGCFPVSRTDFRYDDRLETQDTAGKLYILEVNTQPGMTKTSLLPEQASYCGMSYPELCSWLVEKARCHM